MEVAVEDHPEKETQPGIGNSGAELKATIHDVARKARVSIVSVSRVFNDHPNVSRRMREKVMMAARILGYQPRLVLRPSSIGLLVGDPRRFAAATDMNQICCHISLAAAQSEFQTRLFPWDQVNELTRHSLDGVIEVEPGDNRLYAQKDFPRIPVVLTQNRTLHPAWSSVTVDYEQEGALALETLFHHGHRRIAFLVDSFAPWTHQYRIRGLRERARALGLPDDATPLLDLSTIPFRELAGVLRHEKVSALVSFSSDHVGPLLEYLFNDSGIRIPGELSLLALDNSAFTRHYHPRVCRIEQNLVELAAASVRELLRRMTPDSETRNILIPSRIQHRQTCNSLS